ncbi:hypothetical protein PybrP1_010402, partial [[Pythium] brassicae (nom. inval.)]
EETEQLQYEAAQLEARVKELCDGNAETRELQQRCESERLNGLLRDARRGHQLSFAAAQSALSECLTAGHSCPLGSRIHLGKNWDERRQKLVELRDLKVRNALEYALARSQFLDPLKPHHSDEHTENSSGDFCCSRFDQIQFDGVESVQQVFDALLLCVRSVETSISERLRLRTVRENYDSVGESIANFRLLSAHCGVQVESHSVMFAKLFERHELGGDAPPCGVVVFDAVDDDELFPYRPAARVRKDVASAIVLRAHKRRKSSGSEELVVVMTACKFVSLRRAAFELPRRALRGIRESMCWGLLLVKSINEMLYPEFACPAVEDLDVRAIDELLASAGEDEDEDEDGDVLKDMAFRAFEEHLGLRAADAFALVDDVGDFDFGAMDNAATSALLSALV